MRTTTISYEIRSNGKTVWINSGKTGACLGRFGPMGIDIHYDLGQKSGTECLDCTHKPATLEDWHRFVDGMKEHYGIAIPTKHRPTWLEPTP